MIYCLLIEADSGLTLVDTGIGRQDYTDPSRPMRLFSFWVRVAGDMEETAANQIEKLGYSLADVRDIVLTNLHLDHAGGLRDFPDAKVHIFRTEYESRLSPRGLMERAYDPRHWSHDPKWVVHDLADDTWYGFPSLQIWDQQEPEIRPVPLPSHIRGHCGVAISTPDGWLLQCGDAASPLHPASDIHGLDRSQHTAAMLPKWFVECVLGSNVPKLRELLSN